MPLIPLEVEHDDPTEPESQQIFSSGEVAGQPTRFLIDTGARMSAVDSLGGLADFQVVGSKISHGASGTAVVEDVVLVDEMRIGELKMSDRRVIRSSTETAMLGMDVLASYRCRFDLEAGILDLDEGVETGSAGMHLRRASHGTPFVDVDVAGGPTAALWDTGASLTVVDKRFAADRTDAVAVTGGGATSGIDGAGAAIESVSGRFARCEIGGVQFEESACVVVDLSGLDALLGERVDLIVGVPLIRRAVWTFDFPADRWSITPRSHCVGADATEPF